MIKEVNFKATTRTVNLLGRDNVLDYRSAVLELVKNSYDAFSKRVDMTIDHDCIEIIDYGHGMDIDKIEEVFFTIGTDDKTHTPSRNDGKRKRIMNGSMGIGRLSLGRIGKKSLIITSDSNNAYRFEIDWNVFTTGKDLSTIKIPVLEISLDEFEKEYIKRGLLNPEKQGTIIVSKELNDDWQKGKSNSEKDNYDLLRQSLRKLKNPMKEQEIEEFSIFLKYFNEDIEQIEYTLDNISSDAVIHFTYSYEDDLLVIEGEFPEIDINQFPPDFIFHKFEKLKKYLMRDGKRINTISFYKEINVQENVPMRPPENPIGDFDGTIYFTKNSGGRRYPFIKEAALKQFDFEYESGITLYRDGFRIRPYGEKDTIGFDWIKIENARAKNPAGVARKTYLMQANQLSGFINITKEKNNAFEDQANREGLKNTPEFNYLVATTFEIIKEFSMVRSDIHRWYIEYLKETSDIDFHSEKGKNTKRKIDRLLRKNNGDQEQLFKDPEYQKIVTQETILELYALSDVMTEKNDSLIDESDMLRILATQGIIMSTFVHQIKNDKNFFKNSSKVLRRMGDLYSTKYDVNFDEIDDKNNIYKYSETVDRKNINILGFIESAIKNPKKGKKKKVNIVQYLEQIFLWWSDSIRDNYNKYSYTINGLSNFNELDESMRNIFVYGDDQQLDCIFLNLISNSHKNFEEGEINEREINIDISMESADKVKMIYSDNGIGLSKKIIDKNDIFEPYKSYGEKIKGTGMGMWIVSTIIKSLNGKKKLLSEIGKSFFEIEIVLLGGVESSGEEEN
ncbi:hypothetical protein DOK67_0002274 [Enterococcus sp. DIV0212c]|uniref:sensor histidine kinase n=1 Tax=Enterococcus sp. DIV0212c TaxID=2230867 RepID=UPI001A9BF47C|nr:sensor histidine kinase [Enterococcus sp. DIV0212c]MBO1355321.1 sensor histidine kinase [Enterococcus sp. DIV0212c]